MVAVQLVTVAGTRRRVELPGDAPSGADAHAAAGAALGLAPGRFKLLLRGAVVPAAEGAPAGVAEGDSLLVVPQRRAPAEAAAAAAAEALGRAPPGDDDDEDDPSRFRLPPDAPAWHRALAGRLRRAGAPDLALTWLFTLGPGRLAAFAVVLGGARVASAFGLGSLYLMAAIVAFMLVNLGERREGEASAYSVFNPGVRRLPGQLDAGVFDDQIRRGAGVG